MNQLLQASFVAIILSIGIASGLLLSASPASAEDVDCTTMKDAVATSAQDFAAFRGTRRDLPPDPELAKLQGIEGFSYTRDEYATERRLAAATSCAVIVARAEDPESTISETRFACDWPSTGDSGAQFAAIRQALQDCAISAQVEEDDADSYTLIVDRVESGEGWAGISVSVDHQSANIDAGVSVSVIHVVCQAKMPGGCDDA